MTANRYRVENRDYDADDVVMGTGDEIEVHRRRIEPWLSAIFQSEHLNLLVGSGFSTGLAFEAQVNAASMALATIDPALDAAIGQSATSAAKTMGRGAANIEDQFRSAFALLAGLEVLDDPRAKRLKTGIDAALAKFANSLIEMERQIDAAVQSDEKIALKVTRLLTEFLLSFASRTASRDRLHIFTPNYDRVIEHGLDLIGARPIDRFVGALTPRFRASRFDVDIHYSPPGGRGEARPLEGVVRLTKLHGSVDWRSERGTIVRAALPFGTTQTIAESEASRVMIFPNAAKDIETSFYPYAELFRDFSTAICRPNAALVTYGYGFGDDHINRIIRDMLSRPSTHLVVISFDDAGARIPHFIASCGRPAQVSTIIGPALAALSPLVEHFLPKPAIDSITRREMDLLNHRRPDPPSTGAGP